MQIMRGRVTSATKCCVYGPEGIGKSTFAAQMSNPLFIDTEGSTKHMDVARLPKPSSWAMLFEQVRFVRDTPGVCGSLIIDTIDWAEQLASIAVCAKADKKGIEDFGYGKGYTYLYEEFGKLLNLLDEVIERGIHVMLTAHAKMRKFEQPDEAGVYDRWELKLSSKAEKNISAMVKEWADVVLFANYKTMVVNVDGQGATKGKNKVQGGKRVMYTAHHPCWDAKNRFGLPEELPFEFACVAHCFAGYAQPPAPAQIPSQPLPQAQVATTHQPQQSVPVPPPAPPVAPPVQQPAAPTIPPPQETAMPSAAPTLQTPAEQAGFQDLNAGIPKPLLDLMMQNHITEEEIREVVSMKGYYPFETPIANYDEGFINGWILTVWPQIVQTIEGNPNRLPF